MVQNHVTWGKNTVFNTPAAGTASTPPSKSTSVFGATAPPTPGPTSAAPSLFGAPATPAAPAGGAFSFSSNPVSTPSTTSTPGIGGATHTATTSLFGYTTPSIAATSPAPSTGGFFGTPAATATATATPTQPQAAAFYNPQQAALEAHLNATLYQESTRLESELVQLHAAYSPYQTTTATPAPATTSLFGSTQPARITTPTTNATCRFQHIFYDRMTPSQKTEKISLGITTGHYPQKPNHVPLDVWNQALSRNPDHNEFIPVLITSAEGLHSRLVSQQSKMKNLETSLDTLQSTIDQMRSNTHYQIDAKLENFAKCNSQLKRRLMKIMLKVDLCRGKNISLQVAEQELMNKLWRLRENVDVVEKILDGVKLEGMNYHEQLMLLEQERKDMGLLTGGSSNIDSIRLNDDLKNDLQVFLKEKSDGIEALSTVLKKDERDFGIIKDGLRQANIK